MKVKVSFIAIVLCVFCINSSAFAENNWVFGSQVTSNRNYNPNGLTIQYYPPELGSSSVYTKKRNTTTPYFYAFPGRIEPNVQPNPLRDEMEKTHYVNSNLAQYS